MRFISDKEIDLRREKDQFASLNYSKTLAEIIKDSPKEPFTIGVFGEWGSGKSSIVKTAQGILEDDKDQKYHFFTYDAWKYSKDSFRRTFLLNLAKSLKLEGNDLFRSFYEVRTETVPVKKKLDWRILALLLIILIAAIYLSITGDNTSNWKWTVQTALMAVAIAISFLTNLFKEYVGTRQNPTLFSPEQFEACFDEILARVMKKRFIRQTIADWFRGEHHEKDVDRLIIVLDNIDRCERKLAYELLSDFKNFLGKENVVFVIPVDDSALRTHVASLNESNSEEADEFLRKIFNITIKIKPYKTHDLYEYTEALSSEYGLKLKPDTIDVIAKEYATNPRRIIQFLNSLISEKDYLLRRMGNNFVSEYETPISLILIIREEWPELYSQLSDATYKLRNLEQALELAKGDSKQAEIFLRKTHPHTATIDEKALKVIFTNQEQHPHISDALINALDSRDTKSIKEFIESSNNGSKYLAEYMSSELDNAVGRDVIASLASAFNGIVFLNSISPLTEVENKRILGILSSGESIDKCIQNSDDPELFAIYANLLERQRLYKIQDRLLDLLNRIVETDNDTNPKVPGLLADHLSKLIKSMVKHCESQRVLSRLKKPFYISFRDEDFHIEDLKIPKERLQGIVNTNLVTMVVERYDFPDQKRHGDWMYLIKNGVASQQSIETWIEKFLSHFGDFGTLAKKDFLSQLRLVTDVISSSNCEIKGNLLQQLLDRVFSIRVINIAGQPRVKTSLFAEIAGDPGETRELMDLLGWIYATTDGETNLSQRLAEIAAQSEQAEDQVLKKLSWLHEQFGFSLGAMHDFLRARTRISKELLNLYGWLLTYKDSDQKYSLDDNGAKEIIKKCIDAFLSGVESAALEKSFHSWVKDERAKENLTEIISTLDKSAILKLPQTVQETAYSYISQGDNIFEYQDELEIIAAMNKQDNSTFNKQIEKVILNKFSKDESFKEGIDLLERIESFKGMKKSYLKSLLEEKAEDSELGERIKNIITKL